MSHEYVVINICHTQASAYEKIENVQLQHLCAASSQQSIDGGGSVVMRNLQLDMKVVENSVLVNFLNPLGNLL